MEHTAADGGGNTLPLVSIAIPNYNYGRYLKECVDSALAQTYPAIQVVVSDNASTDGSWEILQAYRDDPRVRIFRQEATLPVGNHFGFVLYWCDGEYVVLLSSDDALKPEFVARTLEVVLAHPERTVSLVAAEREVIDGEGRAVAFPPFYTRSCLIPGDRQAKVFLMRNPFVPSQVLINRAIFDPAFRARDREAGDYDREVRLPFPCMADCSMWFNLCLAGDFGYLRDKLAVYRQHFKGEAAANMGSLKGVFELYAMKLQLIGDARAAGREEIAAHGEAAIRKIGSDCLKWAAMLLQNRNLAAARRLLHMAAAIDLDLEGTRSFKALAYALDSGAEDPHGVFQALGPFIGVTLRDFSYDPPEGALPLGLER